MSQTVSATPTRVAGVRFQRVGKLYHFDCSALPDLRVGDHVIVETVRGEQMGEIAAFLSAGGRAYRLQADLAPRHAARSAAQADVGG